MCEQCERRDRLLDEMVWAVDHRTGRGERYASQAARIIAHARDHVARWHAARHARDQAVIDLRERRPAHLIGTGRTRRAH